MVAATVSVASLVVTGYAPWNSVSSVWLTWWLGDATGIVIFAPLVLLWNSDWQLNWNRRQILEAVALFSSVLLVGNLVFGGWVLTYRTATRWNSCASLCSFGQRFDLAGE